jgi:phosphoadenosine phosphosulfate reductase
MIVEKITNANIALFNQNLRYEEPEAIIKFALGLAERPLVTTSFGAHSAAILYATSIRKNDIQVIWCDTGFNTDATKRHALKLTKLFKLNLEVFTPNVPFENIDFSSSKVVIDSQYHDEFAKKVKLEPFARAMRKYKPDVWFTTIRKGQTTYRDTLDILSITDDGILRVSPFYHFTDEQIKNYLKQHNLPAEYDYFDPVKAVKNRECGIQLRE